MKYFILTALLISSFTVFGHGENKPGPHGGSVQMPGSFHTELLLKSGMATVYLLDMSFNNPTTENSKVSLTVNNNSKSVSAECAAKKTFFECRFPHELSPITGIKLNAVRKGLKGKEAFYPLPLVFSKPASTQDDHSQHHH